MVSYKSLCGVPNALRPSENKKGKKWMFTMHLRYVIIDFEKVADAGVSRGSFVRLERNFPQPTFLNPCRGVEREKTRRLKN